MPNLGPNYAAAFTLYTQGKDFVEISRILGLDLERLKRKAADEGWQRLAIQLRDQLPASAPDDPDRSLPVVQSQKAIAQLARIRANREKNLEIIEQAKSDAAKLFGALVNGSLKIKRHWCHKGLVTSIETDPSPQDRVALATYLQTIVNLGYQALGDRAASGSTDKDGPGASQSVPQITVILPGAVIKERDVTPTNKPIDIESSSEPSA